MARRKQTELGDKVTRDEIIHAAKTVFLEQGFQAAPMRTISKEAGFTSGAIYGYFASKEELFYAITDPVADGLMQILDEVRGEMLALPGKDLIYNMGKVYYPHISRIADHMISHREEMELIVNGSKGTKYEGFLQTIVTRNIDNIDKAVDAADDASIHALPAKIMHILMEGYISTIVHLVLSGEDKDAIIKSMEAIGYVYEKGMISLMKKEKKNGNQR